MLRVLLVAALAVVSFGAPSRAVAMPIPYTPTTYTIMIGATPALTTYKEEGTLTPNIDIDAGVKGKSIDLHANAHVKKAGFSSSETKSPIGDLYKDRYIYVNGGNASNPSATFTYNTKSNVFGLTWGTIDTHNTLTLFASDGNQYAITGTDLYNNISGITYGTTQLDIIVKIPFATIVKAVISASGTSFEAGNFSTVPLPPAVLLFLSGILALVGYGVSKRAGFKS